MRNYGGGKDRFAPVMTGEDLPPMPSNDRSPEWVKGSGRLEEMGQVAELQAMEPERITGRLQAQMAMAANHLPHQTMGVARLQVMAQACLSLRIRLSTDRQCR
jgi:hypothetical protein